jgi:hypothetical protein
MKKKIKLKNQTDMTGKKQKSEFGFSRISRLPNSISFFSLPCFLLIQIKED